LAFESLSIPSRVLIITDASIKNNIATSILHTHIHNRPVTKTLHHAVNITSIEAELFAIRCGINQATNYNDISKIIIVTDSIHAARKIFDPSLYPYQIHTATILNELAHSSHIIRRIQLNFGSALVIATGFFIKWWIKKQNLSTSYHYSCCGNH